MNRRTHKIDNVDSTASTNSDWSSTGYSTWFSNRRKSRFYWRTPFKFFRTDRRNEIFNVIFQNELRLTKQLFCVHKPPIWRTKLNFSLLLKGDLKKRIKRQRVGKLDTLTPISVLRWLHWKPICSIYTKACARCALPSGECSESVLKQRWHRDGSEPPALRTQKCWLWNEVQWS